MIKIVEGKAVMTDQAWAIPLVNSIYNNDRKSQKVSFEMWMRFVYFAYDKKSIYRNYLPEEREKKVVEMLFPDKTVEYFLKKKDMKAFIRFYIESTYSFKEILYRRLLQDIEDMMDRVSKVPMVKKVKVAGDKEVSFYSQIEKKTVKETIKINSYINVDNSEQKLKSMVLLDKLLEREVKLKKALKEEEIANELEKQRVARMFDK